MKGDKLDVLELNQKSDLMAMSCKCPQCGKKYPYGVAYVKVPCTYCGITYKSDFNQDIYTKKARHLLSMLSYKNGLIIKANERYESSLTHIRQHFIEQHCWTVSDIERSNEEYKRCLSCGVCFDCFTCKDCGKAFQRDKNRRKQKCPTCKSSKFVKTYFTQVDVNPKNKEIRKCPHCKSDNIRMTRTRNKTKCHNCNSRKLTDKKTNVVFQITIERKKAYRRENV